MDPFVDHRSKNNPVYPYRGQGRVNWNGILKGIQMWDDTQFKILGVLKANLYRVVVP